MAKRMPKIGGTCFCRPRARSRPSTWSYGVAATGKRAMTSSSSPGISLKMRGHFVPGGVQICPAADCQCAARRARASAAFSPRSRTTSRRREGRGHGDLRMMLVLAPASVQEMAEPDRSRAFDLADQYRMPAMLLADGTMGQMMEPVQLPEARDPDTTEKDWAVTGTKVPAEASRCQLPLPQPGRARAAEHRALRTIRRDREE